MKLPTISQNFIALIFISGLIGVPAGLLCSHYLRKIMGSQVDLGVVNISIAFGLVLIVGMLAILSQTIRRVWIQ